MEEIKTIEIVAYESPRVELYEVCVERGYSVSGLSNERIEGRDDEMDW